MIEMTPFEILNTGFLTVGTLVVLLYGAFLLRRQRERDMFEREKWHTEVMMRQRELERAVAATTASDPSGHAGMSDPQESPSYGGYVFFEMPDDYKSWFHDIVKGFEEFAKLKGYRVSIAVDTTPPGKVGLRFTILDQGVTVSTNTVRSDVDEYITRFRESETFDDLPRIIDPVEHERLKAVLATRFAMVKNNAEMYKQQVEFYKQLAGFGAGSIGYLPAHATIIQNRIEHVGSNVARDTYAADRSPGAAVGKGNTALIEGSTITIDSTLDEIRAQVTGLNELVELVGHSELQKKDDAVRHLINAREELGQ